MHTPKIPPQNPPPEKPDRRQKSRITNPTQQALKAAAGMAGEGRGTIPSDTLGSYTGLAADGGRPEQDGDDV